MEDEQKILNLISDIKGLIEEREENTEELNKARTKVLECEDTEQDLKADIERKREQLDDLIDQATGQNNEDEFGMRTSRSYEF